MLDPLFPVRLESLTLNDAQTVMTGDGYIIAFLAEGRLAYKYIGERGVLVRLAQHDQAVDPLQILLWDLLEGLPRAPFEVLEAHG